MNLLRRPSLHPEVRARCLEVFYYQSNEIDEVCRAQLIELIRDARADSEARCRALDFFGSDAEALAADLLEIDANHQCAEVQRHCLQLLGQKARGWADKWYAIDDISPTVRSACLDIVGQDALPFAKYVLAQWRKWDSETVGACLRIAGSTNEAKAAVRELQQETLSSPELYMQVWVPSCETSQPHPAPLQRSETVLHLRTPWLLTRKRQVLDDWVKLFSADGNGADSDFLREFVAALLTPSLRDDAQRTVKAILLWEKYRPGAFSPELIRLLRQLDDGNWKTIPKFELLLE